MTLPVHRQSSVPVLLGLQGSFDSASTANLRNFCETGRKNRLRQQVNLEGCESGGKGGLPDNKLLLAEADRDFPAEQTWEMSADFANE